MSVLQYVGARYVPKLFTAADGSMEWEPGAYYEPLTVVTYRNASYISRVPVPSSVGAPPENTDYWVLSGNYNGYLADLNERLSAIEKDAPLIGNKRYRNVLLIGDSWSVGVGIEGWMSYVKSAMTAAGFSVQGAGINGAAWAAVSQPPYVTNPYITQLNEASNPGQVDEIWVIGGVNDRLITSPLSAMREFVSRAADICPKASIYYLFIGNSSDSTVRRATLDNMATLKNSAAMCGITFIDGYNILHLTGYFQADKIHPNSVGYTILNPYILKAILSKDAQFHLYYSINASLKYSFTQDSSILTINYDSSLFSRTGEWVEISTPSAPLNPFFPGDGTFTAIQYVAISALNAYVPVFYEYRDQTLRGVILSSQTDISGRSVTQYGPATMSIDPYRG